MDDSDWSWPAWKFGMKKDDLFTKLHDQYNTFTFTLQDPEAFHHDVYEISRGADTTDEFHRLMADRQRQRLSELHESLESLAVEIIANPKLMHSEHWQYALQLFRNKSFDSIIRYFASYLPDNYFDRHDHDTISVASSSSFSETNSVGTESTTASSVDDASLLRFFANNKMTTEPESFHIPNLSSPVIETPCWPSDSGLSRRDSPPPLTHLETNDAYSPIFSSHSLSFHESDSRHFAPDSSPPHVHDDTETLRSDDGDAAASRSDCTESQSILDLLDDKKQPHNDRNNSLEDDDFPTAQLPEDVFGAFYYYNDTLEFDNYTPCQDTPALSGTKHKSASLRKIAQSPQRRSPSPFSKCYSIRQGGIPLKDIRRSPEESYSKIQKHTFDCTKKGLLGRRRLD